MTNEKRWVMRNPKTIDDWIWRLERINFMQDEILSKICIPLLDELKGEEAEWFDVKFKSIMNTCQDIMDSPYTKNHGDLTMLAHKIYYFGEDCFNKYKEKQIKTWVKSYKLINHGWSIEINGEEYFYFGKPLS